MSGKVATSGYGEAWNALVPSTSNGLTGLWMVMEPEIVVTVSGSSQYKGLDPNPQNFYVPAGSMMTVFKPSLSDLIIATADCFAGSKSSNMYVNATDTTGGVQLVWGASQTGSVFSMHVVATTYISIATGAIDNQRVVAYEFEILGL